MIQCELLRKSTKNREKRGCLFYEKFTDSLEIIDSELNNLFEYFKPKVVKSEKLIEICKDKEICPYYFIRGLLKHMKIVVCNYNWIFHDGIRSIVLKELDKYLGDYIIIIDECHNLPEAVLNINEKILSNVMVFQCKNMIKQFQNDYGTSDYFKKLFIKYIRKCGGITDFNKNSELSPLMSCLEINEIKKESLIVELINWYNKK